MIIPIFLLLEKGVLHFCFVLGLSNYVAGPVPISPLSISLSLNKAICQDASTDLYQVPFFLGYMNKIYSTPLQVGRST